MVEHNSEVTVDHIPHIIIVNSLFSLNFVLGSRKTKHHVFVLKRQCHGKNNLSCHRFMVSRTSTKLSRISVLAYAHAHPSINAGI